MNTTKKFLLEVITENQTNTLLEVYPDIVDRVVKNNLSDIDTPERVILESINYQIANLKYHLKELEKLKESILLLIENNEDYLTLYNTIHYNREDVKNKHHL